MGLHSAVEVVEVPTVEDWSEKDCKVVVRTTPGTNLLADLVLRAKVDASPDEVYAVLTHPDSHSIFRGIKATVERKTLEDDGKGRRKLFVHHQAFTRFLWLQVTFSTQLLVEEDDRARTIVFKNARQGGFMQTFNGRWEVAPFNQVCNTGASAWAQDTLNHVYRPDKQQRHHGHLSWLNPAKALAAVQHGLQPTPQESSLVTLEQALAPRIMPPGPLMRMVRGLCARTVSNMMQDLQQEIERRRVSAEGKGAVGRLGGHQQQLLDLGKHSGVDISSKAVMVAPAACMTKSALDLFAGTAPLQLTMEL